MNTKALNFMWNLGLTSDRFNEAFVKDCILDYPNVSRVAIDIGAEHGRHTEHMVQRGFLRIAAFEPMPYNMKILRETRNERNWNYVWLYEFAVGTPGQMRLWLSPQTVGHTTNTEIASRQWPGNKAWEFGGHFKDVPSMSLDEYWAKARERGDTIGLIKCDVEGGELTVFENAEQLLRYNKDWLWILIEVHQGVDLTKLYYCLVDAGYAWYNDQKDPVGGLIHGRHYLVRSAT